MLNAFLMKGKDNEKKSKFYRITEPYFVKMTTSYAESLSGFLQKKWVAYPILIACFGLTALIWMNIQKETAPYDDRSYVSLNVTGPEGASYDYTEDLISRLSEMVNDSIPEKNINLTMVGGMGGGGGGGGGGGSTNSGSLRIRLVEPENRKRSQKDVADHLTRITRRYSEARMSVSQQPTISVNRRGGQPISYIIQAPNFEKLREKLPLFVEEASADPTLVNVDANLKFSKPEINISLDRDKAKNLGVSVLDVAQTLQFALSGQRFAYFIMNGKQYQVIGQYDRADRNDPLDVTSLFVRNNRGELVQLDNLVNIEERSSPPQLYHNNRFMSATVSAGLAPGKSIADGIAAMDRAKAKTLDDTFSTDLSGESRDFQESSSNTAFAFGLALLLVYLILAAQFESFVDPMIIILTVPMAVAGAFLSLWLFGQSWNIFSQIGTIMLIGLVTKNGILIVEFANHLKEQGRPVKVAIQEAAEARLRPILMTSITIALGALPIAMALGAAAKSRMSMGIVIIGGTLFSLILTLFVIPAIYGMWSKDMKDNSDFKDAEDKMKKEKLELTKA